MDTAQFEKHRVSDHHQTSAQAQEQSRSAKGLAHAESAGLARPSDQAAEAFAEFDSELPPVPSEPMAIAKLMSHAHVLIKAREHSLALHILRNVLLRSPQHFDATMAMAQCFRELGQFEQALKCYRSLTKTAETIELKTRAKFFMAETYYLMERDPMALACYRDALKSMTADQEALFTAYKNIGNIYVRAGDFEGGEEFYNKAYTIQPQSDILMVNYGTLEIQRENYEEALARFRQAVAINSQNDKAWIGLAMIHRQMGDLELAQANVERALDINASNRTALRLVVDWGFADLNERAAIRRVQDYIAHDGSEDVEFCFALAKLFTQIGLFHDARIEMERVMALDPLIEQGEELIKALDEEIIKRGRV